MVLSLLVTVALVIWNFAINPWPSALLLVGLYLATIPLQLVVVASVVFGLLRDIERLKAKRAGAADTGNTTNAAFLRFGNVVNAFVTSVYAAWVFRHFHQFGQQSIAIFFIASAASLFFRVMDSRLTTQPQSIVGLVVAMVVYTSAYGIIAR